MRCPHCEMPNDDANALCSNCGMPLTVYGRQVTGEVSAATRAKIARANVRPIVINILAAYCAIAAAGGPFWKLAARFAARTQVNEEGTNYLGAAFGAVGVTFTAIVLVPLGLAFLIVAWGILTQKTWAWWAGLVVLAVALFTAFSGAFFGLGFLRFVMMAGGILLAVGWLRADVREWFGA